MLEVPEVPAPPLPLENGEVGTVNEQEEGEEPELLGKAKKDLAKRDSESVSVDSLGLPKMFNSKKAKADGGSSLEKDDPKPMSTQRPGMRLSEAMGYAEPTAKPKPKAKAVMKRPGMPGVKKRPSMQSLGKDIKGFGKEQAKKGGKNNAKGLGKDPAQTGLGKDRSTRQPWEKQTNANKPIPRAYIQGNLAGGSKHLIVEVTSKMSPNYFAVIGKTREALEKDSLTKDEALKMRADLVVKEPA